MKNTETTYDSRKRKSILGMERRGEKLSKPTPGKLDPGIKKAVDLLLANGIETFESCEGGDGHAFTEPTIRLFGTPEAGWRALGVCLAYGLPVLQLQRVWYLLDSNEPTGPEWQIVFRHKIVEVNDEGNEVTNC